MAVIGAGRIAGRHIRAINGTDGLRALWVVSRTAERARAVALEHGVSRHGTDPQEAITDTSVQVVLVAYPTQEHARLALAAFAAGKDVVCEKPLAWTTTEARAMMAAAAGSGRRLAVCHIRRYWAPCARLAEIARSLGTVRGASWSYRVRQAWPADWRGEAPGGYLLDAHVHDMDLLCWLLGRFPRRVYARGHNSAEGAGILIFSDDSGGLARFDWDGHVLGRDYPGGAEHHAEVLGDRGWGRLSIVGQRLTVDYSVEGMDPGGHEEFTIGEVLASSWTSMWQSFERYMLAGEEPRASPRDAARAVAMVLGAQRSMATDAVISLDDM
ncbi:MAG: hypothetical protein NVSMB65_03860 [Chloroflexota bacterium]